MTQRINKSSRNQTKWWLIFIALLIFPFVLWLLPSTLLDGDKLPFCPSRVIFGIECLGCGMTRAVMHFHHFEFETAFSFNKGVVLVYPILVGLWGKWIWMSKKELNIISKH